MFIPKAYSIREVEFWKRRFEPGQFLSIAEIEETYRLDRSSYGSIQVKIKDNLEKGILDLDPESLQGSTTITYAQTRELIELAQTATEVTGKPTPEMIDLIVRTRSHQVNWEKQRQRLARRG